MSDELSKNEEKVFSELSREKTTPAYLEEKIVQKLKAENLILSKISFLYTYGKWAASVAAIVVVFFAGNYSGKLSCDAGLIDPNNGYLLLLQENENFRPGDPQDMYQEYASWMQGTFEKGIKISGQELKNTSTRVTSQGVSEFIGGQTEFKTTGYFRLEAKSREEALEVAKGNPHVKYGGIVELKEYMVR